MSIHIKHKLKMQSLDYRLWDLWKKSRWATHLSWIKLMFHGHDWFVIHYWAALQGNVHSETGGHLVWAAKRQNGGQIRFPVPLPPSQHCYQTSDFWGKGVVAYISRKILGGSFHIKIMLEEKNNIVWTPNSKLLLNLMIRAKKLSELNPI